MLSESTYVVKSVTLRHQLDEHGDPWFVAKDVCDYLEIANVSDACTKLFDSNSRGIATTDTADGRTREMIFVNEPGLYQLIFQSRKPEAREFQRWVFEDLLPNLRKQGYYRMPGRTLPGITGKTTHGRQPFLDEIRKRGISQSKAFEQMNELVLGGVPLLELGGYRNACYGQQRPSASLARRASELLGMPVGALFTAPIRDPFHVRED